MRVVSQNQRVVSQNQRVVSQNQRVVSQNQRMPSKVERLNNNNAYLFSKSLNNNQTMLEKNIAEDEELKAKKLAKENLDKSKIDYDVANENYLTEDKNYTDKQNEINRLAPSKVIDYGDYRSEYVFEKSPGVWYWHYKRDPMTASDQWFDEPVGSTNSNTLNNQKTIYESAVSNKETKGVKYESDLIINTAVQQGINYNLSDSQMNEIQLMAKENYKARFQAEKDERERIRKEKEAREREKEKADRKKRRQEKKEKEARKFNKSNAEIVKIDADGTITKADGTSIKVSKSQARRTKLGVQVKAENKKTFDTKIKQQLINQGAGVDYIKQAREIFAITGNSNLKQLNDITKKQVQSNANFTSNLSKLDDYRRQNNLTGNSIKVSEIKNAGFKTTEISTVRQLLNQSVKNDRAVSSNKQILDNLNNIVMSNSNERKNIDINNFIDSQKGISREMKKDLLNSYDDPNKLNSVIDKYRNKLTTKNISTLLNVGNNKTQLNTIEEAKQYLKAKDVKTVEDYSLGKLRDENFKYFKYAGASKEEQLKYVKDMKGKSEFEKLDLLNKAIDKTIDKKTTEILKGNQTLVVKGQKLKDYWNKLGISKKATINGITFMSDKFIKDNNIVNYGKDKNNSGKQVGSVSNSVPGNNDFDSINNSTSRKSISTNNSNFNSYINRVQESILKGASKSINNVNNYFNNIFKIEEGTDQKGYLAFVNSLKNLITLVPRSVKSGVNQLIDLNLDGYTLKKSKDYEKALIKYGYNSLEAQKAKNALINSINIQKKSNNINQQELQSLYGKIDRKEINAKFTNDLINTAMLLVSGPLFSGAIKGTTLMANSVKPAVKVLGKTLNMGIKAGALTLTGTQAVKAYSNPTGENLTNLAILGLGTAYSGSRFKINQAKQSIKQNYNPIKQKGEIKQLIKGTTTNNKSFQQLNTIKINKDIFDYEIKIKIGNDKVIKDTIKLKQKGNNYEVIKGSSKLGIKKGKKFSQSQLKTDFLQYDIKQNKLTKKTKEGTQTREITAETKTIRGTQTKKQLKPKEVQTTRKATFETKLVNGKVQISKTNENLLVETLKRNLNKTFISKTKLTKEILSINKNFKEANVKKYLNKLEPKKSYLTRLQTKQVLKKIGLQDKLIKSIFEKTKTTIKTKATTPKATSKRLGTTTNTKIKVQKEINNRTIKEPKKKLKTKLKQTTNKVKKALTPTQTSKGLSKGTPAFRSRKSQASLFNSKLSQTQIKGLKKINTTKLKSQMKINNKLTIPKLKIRMNNFKLMYKMRVLPITAQASYQEHNQVLKRLEAIIQKEGISQKQAQTQTIEQIQKQSSRTTSKTTSKVPSKTTSKVPSKIITPKITTPTKPLFLSNETTKKEIEKYKNNIANVRIKIGTPGKTQERIVLIKTKLTYPQALGRLQSILDKYNARSGDVIPTNQKVKNPNNPTTRSLVNKFRFKKANSTSNALTTIEKKKYINDTKTNGKREVQRYLTKKVVEQNLKPKKQLTEKQKKELLERLKGKTNLTKKSPQKQTKPQPKKKRTFTPAQLEAQRKFKLMIQKKYSKKKK